MSTITFACPSCGHPLRVAAEKAGQRGKCIKCGVALTIPTDSEQRRSYDWGNVKLGALIALFGAAFFLVRYGVEAIVVFLSR